MTQSLVAACARCLTLKPAEVACPRCDCKENAPGSVRPAGSFGEGGAAA